jgi:hypothetical protein
MQDKKISHPLVNFRGDRSSWYMAGREALKGMSFSMAQYIGLLALKNGGTVTFDKEDLEQVKSVRLVFDERGGTIVKVVVNEDITPEAGMRTVAVQTEYQTNERARFWGYATQETVTPYLVYLDESVTKEDEIEVISELLSKDEPEYDQYRFSKHPELDMLRAMKNPKEWDIDKLARLEAELKPKENPKKDGILKKLFS